MAHEVLAIDDLRHTAYAYQKALTKAKGNEDDLLKIFNEMDADNDDRISFAEFESYMRAKGYKTIGSDRHFFDKLASQRGYLEYRDVVTLLYIINSGRPYCDVCRYFIQGSFFTCATCFEREKEYHYNMCPNCYGSKEKKHKHDHKEFVDPLSLLRLIAKRDSIKPTTTMATGPNKSSMFSSLFSNKKYESRPSTSKTIIVPNSQTVRLSTAMKLMESAAACATIATAVAQFCTIM